MMKHWILCFLISSASLFAKGPDLLFVGFDAGETNIWAQVLKSWEDAPKTQVLTMATATKIAKEASLSPICIENFGISCPSNQRLYEFSSTDLEKIDQLSASVLITGMYSSPERQIAELFHKKGSQVVAVWDNFSTYEKLPLDLVVNVEKIIHSADAVLVPSIEIADDLNQRFSTHKAIALGQPTLDLWEERLAQVDKVSSLAKTSFRADAPILTYIGGYEEKSNGYNDSFHLFVKSVNALKIPVQIIVQLHPRSDGSFEKEILEKYACQNPQFPAYIISNGKQLSTYEAVAIADLGICHRSTVATQALFAGKRFMHIDLPRTTFSNFAIEKCLTAQCLSAEEATQYLAEHLHEPIDLSSLYEKSGISPNATQHFQSYLANLIQHEKN